MMIGVANEHDINRIRWQIDAVLSAQNARDIFEVSLIRLLNDVLNKTWRNIDRIDPAAIANTDRKQSSKQARPGPHIGDEVTQLNSRRLENSFSRDKASRLSISNRFT